MWFPFFFNYFQCCLSNLFCFLPGAQPPLELIRQGLADGGWYDRSDSSFRTLTNISYVAAMVPPGGGRNAITSRLTRHFEVIGVAPMDTMIMEKIFTTILEWR